MRRSSEPHTVSGHRRGPRDPLLDTWLDGRYLIEERIATGGFGAVYRARDAGGMALALKVLHPSLTDDPSAVARFQREGATLTQLHDAHTVTTLAVGETRDGTRYIAMELLTGESLHARLHRDRVLPWQTAVAIAQAVCSSLAEAHALGVVHRDLKPDNIHVEQRGGAELVKVIDFGIVKIAPGSAIDDGQELTSAGHMIGTYDYMSPEQLVGGACEAASDIYSLGVVLYEMLTGERPFSRLSSPAAMMTALLLQTPQPPSVFAAIPPALDRIVMRCLEREPQQRFASALELAAALARLLARRLTAREEITEVHPICPRAIEATRVPCATWSDTVFLHANAGEDAAICRDPRREAGREIGREAGRDPGATLIDDEPRWREPAAADDRAAPTWPPPPLERLAGAPIAHGTGPVERSPAIAPRWTDPRGIAAVPASLYPTPPRPSAPALRPPRGSVRALGSFDGSTTLPGVAVATERTSQPRIAAPRRPSAEAMLAPSLPTSPLIRLASSSQAARRARPSGAIVLICAALVAGVATFLLATLL